MSSLVGRKSGNRNVPNSRIYNKESESTAREVDKRPMQEDTDAEGQRREGQRYREPKIKQFLVFS